MTRRNLVKDVVLERAERVFRTIVAGAVLLVGAGGERARAQGIVVVEDGRTARHASAEWARVAPHLPNLQTSNAEQLMMAGDILRARRFPEDALDYYKSAVTHGGDAAKLLNRMGVTELELQHVVIAQLYFRKVVKLYPKIADGWNNLGATEYLQRDYGRAIKDYRKAAHIDDGRASYRSNLGTAYFEVKNFKKARKEFDAALALDPEVFTKQGSGGVTAHILSPEDRARFSYELAKVSLSHGDEAGMLHWLEKASEGGFDLRHAMGEDAEFVKYREDPRVLVLIANGIAMKTTTSSDSVARLAPIAAMPAGAHDAGTGGSAVEK